MQQKTINSCWSTQRFRRLSRAAALVRRSPARSSTRPVAGGSASRRDANLSAHSSSGIRSTATLSQSQDQTEFDDHPVRSRCQRLMRTGPSTFYLRDAGGHGPMINQRNDDPSVEVSSPACSMHGADDAYMGYAGKEQLS